MGTKSSIKHRIIRAGTITFLGSALSLAMAIVVRMVIARVYGPEGMGKYAGFMMFLSLFGTISMFALPRAVLKFVAEYEEKNQFLRARSLFSSIFLFTTLTCLLVAIGSQFFTAALAKLVNLPADRSLAIFLGLTLILSAQSMLTSTLFLSLFQNIRAFVISISSMIAMLAGAGYVYLVAPFPVYLLLVAGYLVSGLLGSILAVRQGMLGPVFSGDEIKKSFRFALPIIFMSYLAFFVEWFDRFTLGMYFGVKEMGLFSAGLVVFTAARRLPLSLTEVLVPSYSKLSLQGKEVLSRAYGKNVFYYAIVFFFTSLVLVIFRRELITILFTKEFSPAADILLILGGTFILSVITNPGSALLVGCGYTKLNTINYVAGAVVLLPALMIFTRHWGINGAAAAKVLSHLVTTGGMIFILTRIIKIRFPFRRLFQLLVLAFISGFIAGLSKYLIPFLPLSIVLLPLLYFGGLWLIILNPEDKGYLKDICLKLKSGTQMIREPSVNWSENEGVESGTDRSQL